MAVTRSAKKLCQSTLASTVTAEYTSPANTKTQVTEIWLTNTSGVTRTISLYAHGLANVNTLISSLPIEAGGVRVINGSKIVLEAAEVLGGKQDVGEDVILTAYGIQEVTS